MFDRQKRTGFGGLGGAWVSCLWCTRGRRRERKTDGTHCEETNVSCEGDGHRAFIPSQLTRLWIAYVLL